jgi:hypothetical protein
MPAMTITKISWCLCALFVLALLAESAITVAADGTTVIHFLMGAWARLAILVVAFRFYRLPEPKWLVRVLLGVAAVTTMRVVLMVVG